MSVPRLRAKHLPVLEKKGFVLDPASGAHGFLKSYNSYIKINVQYWGLSLAKGSSVVGWLESRCLALLVGKFFSPGSSQLCSRLTVETDLERSLPDIHARIWPARFTLNDTSSDKDERE